MAQNSAQSENLIFAEEALVVEAQGLLQELMDEKGISRADLARSMGVSRPRVTQIFSDECKNFTLRLLARAFYALGEGVVINYARAIEDRESQLAAQLERALSLNVSNSDVWNELETTVQCEQLSSANDNIFGSLGAVRDANARYGMAA